MYAWHVVWVIAFTGCTSSVPLVSGSYVPLAGEEAPGLLGLNLNVEEQALFFVLDEEVQERPLSWLEEDKWPRRCKKSSKQGIAEESAEVGGEPILLTDGEVADLVLSSWCGEEGALRLAGTPEWELHLEPLQ